MPMNRARALLLVEDDPRISDALEIALSADGWNVERAITGSQAETSLAQHTYAAVLLDVMIPAPDGIAILTALRARGDRTPVLILTAQDGVDQRVRGLDAGADDYLPKPFAVPEVLARVRALTRRATDQATVLRVADLELDLIGRGVQRGGRELDLTNREFDLLATLAKQAGTVVAREQVAQEVWGDLGRHSPIDNVIDVHVARLRRKLDVQPPYLLHTVRGVGYLLGDKPA
jgi:two-component system, OmpR family, copper resistance phosphate regulon response regulator CusR